MYQDDKRQPVPGQKIARASHRLLSAALIWISLDFRLSKIALSHEDCEFSVIARVVKRPDQTVAWSGELVASVKEVGSVQGCGVLRRAESGVQSGGVPS